MDTIHSEKVGVCTVKLVHDDHCDNNPRDWDDLGTMACWHKRYLLGDQVTRMREGKPFFPTPGDFNQWSEKRHELPLYLYDHSGITMNTTGFHCPWDSGQVGWIYVTDAKIREEFHVKRITEALRKKVTDILVDEVRIYDAHLTGSCFGYVVEDEDGNQLDSCWGYHGTEHDNIDWKHALIQARASASSANANLATGAYI